ARELLQANGSHRGESAVGSRAFFAHSRHGIDFLFVDGFGRNGRCAGTTRRRGRRRQGAHRHSRAARRKGRQAALAHDELTIKGETRCAHAAKRARGGPRRRRTERSYGAFQRTITVPDQIDPELVSAASENAVLMVTLTKPVDAAAQKHGRIAPTELGAHWMISGVRAGRISNR